MWWDFHTVLMSALWSSYSVFQIELQRVFRLKGSLEKMSGDVEELCSERDNGTTNSNQKLRAEEPHQLDIPRRHRNDSGQNVILTPPKENTPRDYDSTYIFEDSMTEDLEMSPVMNRTFSVTSDEEDDKGFPQASSDYRASEGSFTISEALSTDSSRNDGCPDSALNEECYSDDELININLGGGRESIFNLSIIYEENSFELICEDD